MNRPARLTALAAGLALTAGLLSPATATAQTAERARPGSIAKLKWPGHGLVVDSRGVVKGKVKGRKRTVVLEQLIPNRGWSRVDRDKTSKKGKFKLKVPTSWYHGKLPHRVRVVGGRASKSYGVTVKPPYKPVGKKSFWTRVQKGQNWQYNPCRPVTWRVNYAMAPAGAREDVTEAVRRLEVATGINFKFKGETSNTGASRKRWPKGTNLLIVWHTNQTSPINMGNHTGVGGPLWGRYMRGPGGRVAATVKSRVIMNAGTRIPAGFGGTATGTVLMHELGHASGLGHVLNHPGQVMSYDILDNWQAGDLAGLRKLGKQGGCLSPYRGGRIAAGGIEAPRPLF